MAWALALRSLRKLRARLDQNCSAQVFGYFSCLCAVLRKPSRWRVDADGLSFLYEKSLVEDAHDGVNVWLIKFQVGIQLVVVTSQSERYGITGCINRLAWSDFGFPR